MQHADLGGDDDMSVVVAPARQLKTTGHTGTVGCFWPPAPRRLFPLLRPYVEVGAGHMTHTHGGNIYVMVDVDGQRAAVTLACAHAGNETRQIDGDVYGWR